MNRLTPGKLLFGCVRSFIIFISFTLDIKVHADVIVQSVSGQVEFEKKGQLVNLSVGAKVAEPLEIETFSRSITKIQEGVVDLGVGEYSLLSLEGFKTNGLHLSATRGVFYFSAPEQDHGLLTIETPQGSVTAKSGEFVITVNKNKTQVSVVSGQVNLKDRASGHEVNIRAGYTLWQGGLLAQGEHARGQLNALDFSTVLIAVKNLSLLSGEEWQRRYDNLHPLWKQAVEDVAQQNQDQVIGDMQLLAEIQESERKKEKAASERNLKTRLEFRAKFLGGPEIDKADPSASDRAPASSDE